MQGRRIQHERGEQETLVTWFNYQYPKELMFSVPNDLIRTCVQARTAARTGLRGGVPDLFIAAPIGGFAGMFLEMKRLAKPGEPRGRLTEKQKAIISHLTSKGYFVKVAFGFEEARIAIENYLGNKHG